MDSIDEIAEFKNTIEVLRVEQNNFYQQLLGSVQAEYLVVLDEKIKKAIWRRYKICQMGLDDWLIDALLTWLEERILESYPLFWFKQQMCKLYVLSLVTSHNLIIYTNFIKNKY